MSSTDVFESEPQIVPRNPYARSGPIPDLRLEGLFQETPVLVKRQDSSSSSSPATTSCGPNDNSGVCEKYYNSDGTSTTLPIVLGVVIPLTIALVILIVLHRRHVKKLRKEDAEDKHKSLDFGLDESVARPAKKGRGKNLPQMSMADTKESIRRDRGLSMDLGMHNPYLLPPELQQSRESLHSLSRTGEDKYRATDFFPDDGSIRAPSSMRSRMDDSSSFTGSSRRFDMDSKQNLLRNAQANPGGFPPRRTSVVSGRNNSVDPQKEGHNPLPPIPNSSLLAPAQNDTARDSFVSTTSSVGAVNALRASNNYLGMFISGGAKSDPGKGDLKQQESVTTVSEVPVTPPEEIRSPPPALIKDNTRASHKSDSSFYQDSSIAPTITLDFSEARPEERQPRLPQLSFIDPQGVERTSIGHVVENGTTTQAAQPEPSSPQHRSLPSADLSRQEANESQSVLQPDSARQSQYCQSQYRQSQYDDVDDYYDEYETYYEQDLQSYQDPRHSMLGMRPLPPDDPSENPEQRANRIRSFYKEYFDESKSNQAQQYHPQQHNVQYYDGSEDYYDEYYDDYEDNYYPPRGHSQQANYYGGHRPTFSQGSYMPPGPRAFSSASGRYGAHPRFAPKKKLPPPKPLNMLPTPHMLKDDTFIPIDFAPPQKFANQRAGTPDSLRGGERPFSPSLRPHVPLASAYDELAPMPSPHQLRKSATFTALDFAPPRFIAKDTASETGSIRSNRSGLSAMHAHNIRNGAYRVSRIPKEVAGSRDELTAALKPTWNMHR